MAKILDETRTLVHTHKDIESNIYKKDVQISIVVKRKLLINSSETQKTADYIFPIIQMYQDKVIYITDNDENTIKPIVKDAPLIQPEALNFLRNFKKVTLHVENANTLTDTDVHSLLEFIDKHKNDKTLLVIDNAVSILGEYARQIICNPPEDCILVVENQSQLSDAYKNTDSLVEQDVVKNYWAILSIDEVIRDSDD